MSDSPIVGSLTTSGVNPTLLVIAIIFIGWGSTVLGLSFRITADINRDNLLAEDVPIVNCLWANVAAFIVILSMGIYFLYASVTSGSITYSRVGWCSLVMGLYTFITGIIMMIYINGMKFRENIGDKRNDSLKTNAQTFDEERYYMKTLSTVIWAFGLTMAIIGGLIVMIIKKTEKDKVDKERKEKMDLERKQRVFAQNPQLKELESAITQMKKDLIELKQMSSNVSDYEADRLKLDIQDLEEGIARSTNELKTALETTPLMQSQMKSSALMKAQELGSQIALKGKSSSLTSSPSSTSSSYSSPSSRLTSPTPSLSTSAGSGSFKPLSSQSQPPTSGGVQLTMPPAQTSSSSSSSSSDILRGVFGGIGK